MNNNAKISLVIFVVLLATSFFVGLIFINKNNISDFNINNKYFNNQQTASVINTVSKKENNTDNTANIIFVGDMMFDRYIRQMSDKYGNNFSFQKIEPMFKNSDLVVGNLEGPITDNQSVSVNSKMGEKNNYIFTFDPKFAQTLSNENIRLVNIGNNHITNFGNAGIESTRLYLQQSKVDFFGDPEDSDKRMIIENIKNIKIAFVNYDQFVENSEQKTVDDISRAKNLNADFIIVYTHWGTEFVNQAGENIKALAHEFVNDGADLIIGSHPHVIQQKEEYAGKTIYYSLGNFIFDQYFDPRTQEGLIVQVQLSSSDKNIKLKEYKIKILKTGQVTLLDY